jgi:hypothetical protein
MVSIRKRAKRVLAIVTILTALFVGSGPRAQNASEQASIKGVQNGMQSSASYYSCSGLVPAFNAVTNALNLFGTINDMGQLGESIVSSALGGISPNTQIFLGRKPDFITVTNWVEVKNTKVLSYTKQLVETGRLARSAGRIYTIVTRVNTKLSPRLLRAMANGSVKIIKCLPEIIEGQLP